jgi:hypothetical protein
MISKEGFVSGIGSRRKHFENWSDFNEKSFFAEFTWKLLTSERDLEAARRSSITFQMGFES